MSEGSQALPWRRAALFSVIMTMGTFLVFELLLAIFGTPSGPVYVMRPGILWAMEPSLSSSPMLHLESGRRFSVTTNADGLRGARDRDDDKASTTVLWLGDSTIFGWGVDDGQDPPSALAVNLRQQLGTDQVEVINGGAPGYSSLQSFMLLREIGVHYKPDVVLLEFSLHNFRSAKVVDSAALEAPGASVLSNTLASTSRVYREMRRLLLTWTHPSSPVRGGLDEGDWGQPDPRAEQVRVPPDDFRSLLDAAASIGEDQGYVMAVSFPPRYHRTIPEVYLSAVAELVEDERIVLVDYTDPFLRLGGGTNWNYLPTDPGHYNPKGGYLVGSMLAQALITSGLVGQ